LKKTTQGFTLIELLVVIVIIALLMAIAIPAYLSQQKKAKASKTQQYLATAYRSARGELVSNGGSNGYPTANAISTLLRQDQPQLTFKVGASTLANTANNDEVVIGTNSTTNTLYLYAKSGSGDKYRLTGNQTGTGVGNAIPVNIGAPPAGYLAVILADSPLAYWRLNETVGTTSAPTVGGVTGNYNGGFSLGTVGATSDGDKAATFNGTSGYIDAGNNFNLTATGSWTVEAWVKVTAANGGTQGVIGKTDFNNGWVMDLDTTLHPRIIRCYNTGSCNPATAGATTLSTGTWYLLDGVYNSAAQTLCLYINGVEQTANCATGMAGNMLATAPSLWIGNENPGVRYFNGSIDEPAIYNAALSPAALLNHYTSR
jgi:prepilin-type N-terminal cleavage/methylation domain-containing protein